jgi:cytochrome P450
MVCKNWLSVRSYRKLWLSQMAPIPDVNITSSEFKANPFPFYARLRSEAPAYRTILPDKRHAWLVTRYQDVVFLLKDDRFSKDKMTAQKLPWMPGMFKPLMRNMLDLDAPDHTRLRGLVHKVFTPRLIEKLRQRIQDLTEELLNRVQSQGKTDLIHDYALQIPTTIIAEMLGVPVKDRLKFHRWSSAGVSSSASRFGILKAIPYLMAFVRYIRSLVKTRRVQPQDDLISALAQAEEAGEQLSEDELLAMIVLLLVAGHETTVNLIGNAVLALLEHPDQLSRLQDDPGLIKTGIEELLRHSGPLETATERYPREDTSVAGMKIPRGELVFAVLASANRDEEQFEHADRLDLGREPNPHVAFGQGLHYCLGAPLARLEGQIAISTLLRRVKNLKLAIPPDRLRWRRGLVLRGLEALPVEFSRSK